jgi:oxygen-independent coproporphyrinogen-3 oxidase
MKEPFLVALHREIALTHDYLAGEEVNTIYFGGGTPSVYRPAELDGLIPHPPAPTPKREGGALEVTLELNPEDVTEDYVEELQNTVFNRFSLGVQSFDADDLIYLNRSHGANQAVKAVRLLQNGGFENISIDLIYGIPSSSDEKWRKNLETAFSLDVPHISAYALTVEPKTPLAWMIAHQRSAPVNDEVQVSQFKLLMKMAREHGFQQYEISNFAKPGLHAIHNTNYWNGVPYLGLGPSAHSYNWKSRRWNITSLTAYLTAISEGKLAFGEEILTTEQRYNEYVMTSLRTMWGFNPAKKIDELRITNYEFPVSIVMPFMEKGWLTENSGVYFLTDEGKLFADRIASDLFVVSEQE